MWTTSEWERNERGIEDVGSIRSERGLVGKWR